MKIKFLFLSSVLCMCVVPALCSDCVDTECDAAGVEYELTEVHLDTVDTPEFYLQYDDNELVSLYNDIMTDAMDTRTRIEELLNLKHPDKDVWQYDTQDVTGCPFDTESECEIWRSKPIVRENVSPRSPKIRDDKMNEFLANLDLAGGIDANSDAAAPLVARYKMLMNSARACCTEGMVYSLRRAGATDGLIYKFMSDDANFYHIGNRCLMTTDAEIDAQYGNTATASVIADVRNGCLCRGREWFTAMLAPFVEAWNLSPDFAASPFIWTYRDGLNRNITVSINNDVQNVLNQLSQCP